MATLKESGEAWIAAGQAEYGQMLIEAAVTIERLQKEVERFREEREARNFMGGIQWSEEDQERMSKLDAEPLKLNRIRPPTSD